MKKLFVFSMLLIVLFSCAKENEIKVKPDGVPILNLSIEERNVNWLRLDSLSFDSKFQVIYFFDKGQKRQLGIFNKSPFLSYPNQSFLIERTINVNIKKENGREYLIFKNK